MESRTEILEAPIKVFAVRNREGKWFRAKGYRGYGESWVDDIAKAKIYPKSGGARRTITWFYNNYPEYGACYFVELNISSFTLIDETDILTKKKEKKEQEEQERQIRQKENALKKAQDDLERAKRKIEELKK